VRPGRVTAVASLAVAMLAAGCSGDHRATGEPTYNVRVTAGGDEVTLTGCHGCPVGISPHTFFQFVEKRTPPTTYSITVRGRTSRCPTLQPVPQQPNAPSGSYGRDWFLTVDPKGSCIEASPSSPAG